MPIMNQFSFEECRKKIGHPLRKIKTTNAVITDSLDSRTA